MARARARRDALGAHREQRRATQAFDATLGLAPPAHAARSPASAGPAATLRMLALIYGHAVALKLKGVPVQPHPRDAAA